MLLKTLPPKKLLKIWLFASLPTPNNVDPMLPFDQSTSFQGIKDKTCMLT